MVRLRALLLVAMMGLAAAPAASARPALRRLPATPKFAKSERASVHQTFTVDTPGDPSTGTNCQTGHPSGTCSLRAAINAADTDTGHIDEVMIPSGTHVTLSQGTSLDVTNSMVIDGAGASVNGGGSQVFNLFNAPSVQIVGLAITGADATGEGGGVYCDKGSLILSDVHVAGNVAADGAGVFSDSKCRLWVDGSTVKGNTATPLGDAPGAGYGGGLYVVGSAYITRSTIGDPTGTADNLAASGAGIYDVGNVTLSDSEIQGNTSGANFGKGVGIYNGGVLSVSDSTIALNTAPAGGDGGGLNSGTGGVTQIVGSRINSNTETGSNGSDGAGIYGSGNVLSLTNDTLDGNSASSSGGASVYGGALYSADNQLTLSGVSVKNTTSGTSGGSDFVEGGAMYLGGKHTTLAGVTISNTTNDAAPDKGVDGGALYVDTDAELRGVSISHTTSTGQYVYGGAIDNNQYAALTGLAVSSTTNTATGSSAYVYGGALYNAGNNMSLAGSAIQGTTDTAAPPSGSVGPTYIYGGDIYNAWDITVDGLSMAKLKATASGGSGYIYGGSLYNSDYLSARDLDVGGATVKTDAYVYGGLVYNNNELNATDLTLGPATVSLDGTSAPYAYGTILYDDNGAASNIVNGTFDNVSSTVPPAGTGLYAIDETGQLQLTNATIANDSLSGPTGTFLLLASGSGASVSLHNSIVDSNRPALNCGTSSGGAIVSSGYNLDNGHSCGFADVGDEQNANPKVAPLAANGGAVQTAALKAGSPAINAASNTGCPPTDARGVTRPFGKSCDMGAYEATSPFVTTGPATNITRSAATLTGTVNPDDQATRYYFQYGTTTRYGKTTPTLALPAGYAAHRVARSITGLKQGQTYHYRLVAVSGVGTSYGADRTFKPV